MSKGRNNKSFLLNLKSYFSGFGLLANPSNYSTATVNYYLGGTRKVTETHSIQGQLAAYEFCPAVTGIVNRKTKSFMNGYWMFVDKDGKESKSIEVKDLKKLLEKPNSIQSWKSFIAQAKSYEQIFGECFIYALRPYGMNVISSLWVIPNWIGQPGYKDNTYMHPPLFEGYENFVIKDEKGFEYEIPLDDILIIRDIGTNPINPIKGQSRLISLQDPVSNIIAAYEARNVLITRRGAIGILSNDSKDAAGQIPIDPEEKAQLQKDFSSYGITKDKFQAIISNANLRWQQMTFPTKDLLLFEEIEDDTRQIADNYDYPNYLLGFKNGSTFNNVNEAKKSLYQDAIIPESEIWAESFTRFFGLEKTMVDISFKHLDVFKKGEKEKAETNQAISHGMQVAYQNQIVTREEWRMALGYDPDTFTGDTFYQQTEPEPEEVVNPEMIKIFNNGKD
jgi:hypothetical protein